MRHFLDITDLSRVELDSVLRRAVMPIGELGRPLDGHGVALIFEKPSNRTRQSMEMAVAQLGGHPVYTRGEEVGFDVREPVEDVTKIMAGYHAVLAARVVEHSVVTRMAALDVVPVVNMLSEWSHPLQGLADALTMQQCLGPLDGKTVAYVGDYNNVARSLAEVSTMLGAHVRLGCPSGFEASPAELERIGLLGGGAGSVIQFSRAIDAVEGAQAVHTDTWTSMGQEAEKAERVRVFEAFQVDDQVMAAAASGALFFHCLPAYRGYEVAASVIDGPRSRVIEQGHNRLHAARGLLSWLIEANQA